MYDQYEAYAKSTRIAGLMDKKRKLKKKIKEKTEFLSKVYGTCRDGSFQLGMHHQVKPLEKELEEVEAQINVISST